MDGVDAADKAVAEDVDSVHHLQPTCRIRRRVPADAVATEVSQLHQVERNLLANQRRKLNHTRTLPKFLQTGMYATRAGLAPKTDIRRSLAHEGGTNQNIKRGLIGTSHRHTLMPGGNRALKEGIRRSSQDSDGVGRSMK